jgi:broad specificity phosphatase PhoE
VRTVHVLTHPEVVIDPELPIAEWGLTERGQDRARQVGRSLSGIGSLWTSTETKAVQAAQLVGAELGLQPWPVAELGEMDRSSTGYLPEPEFWATYQEFLARPSTSVRGWETAMDAQRRFVAAVGEVLADDRAAAGDVAIMCHGGVGALLMCRLRDVPIQRLVDQPSMGSYFSFDADGDRFIEGWLTYEELAQQRAG